MITTALCAVLGVACAAPEDRPDIPVAHTVAPAVAAPAALAPAITAPAPVAVSPEAPEGIVDCDLPAHCVASCGAFSRTFVVAGRLHPSRSTVCHRMRQACQESRCEPDARSPADAFGIMQIKAGAASDMGIDPWDPNAAIVAGAKYLAWCEGPWTPPPAYGRTDADIRIFSYACYNWGRGNTIRDNKRNGWATGCEAIEHFPAETQHYAKVIERPKC